MEINCLIAEERPDHAQETGHYYVVGFVDQSTTQ